MRRGGLFVPDDRDLLSGVAIGVHSVGPHDAHDRLGDAGAVAGDEDGPLVPQRSHHPRRVGAERVREEDASQPSVDGGEHRQ